MQITILEPLIGTNLYDKILIDFNADTLIGLYSTLYTDYIKPLLVHCVFADFVTTGAYRVENAGIFKHTPNNAENISKTEIITINTEKTNAVFLSDSNILYILSCVFENVSTLLTNPLFKSFCLILSISEILGKDFNFIE